jgi:hypothetical protein
MNGFGAEARKSRSTGLVGRQFVAQSQDFPGVSDILCKLHFAI